MSDLYLVHFGIKGQKWGVRHWQNPDGTFNEAGKKRYFNTDVKSKKELYTKLHSKYQKETSKNVNNMNEEEYEKHFKEATRLKNAIRIAKDDIKNEEIKEKINSENKKSKNRLKYEEEFKKQGYNEEEAAVAAYKKEKAQKIILAAAGITLAACAAYGAYKYYDYTADKNIKEGSIFKRVTIDPSTKLHDAFYAAGDRDAKKYVGMYGKQLKSQDPGAQINQKILRATDNIKIASEKNSLNTLRELISNNDIDKNDLKRTMIDQRDMFVKAGYGNIPAVKKLNKAIDSLDNDQVNKHVYEAFNRMLADHSSKNTKTFYDALKSKGYDAIRDINDRKLSGYNSKTAHIFFNNSKMNVDDVKKLTDSQINKAFDEYIRDEKVKSNGKQFVKKAAVAGGIVTAAIAADKNQKHVNDTKIINEYKKEHPDTKLSKNEILLNYYGGK